MPKAQLRFEPFAFEFFCDKCTTNLVSEIHLDGIPLLATVKWGRFKKTGPIV